MTHSDAFKILGLVTSASLEQITARYKLLAKQYHPDLHSAKNPARQQAFAKKFAEVNEAYEKAREFFETHRIPDQPRDIKEFETWDDQPTSEPVTRPSPKPFSRQVATLIAASAAVFFLLVINHQTKGSNEGAQQRHPLDFLSKLDMEFTNAIGSAEQFLEQNNYQAALRVLAKYKKSETQSPNCLRVLYRAEVMKAQELKSNPFQYASTLLEKSHTLHFAVRYHTRCGNHTSVRLLFDLAEASYCEAIDVVSAQMKEKSANKAAARLAVVTFHSYGTLLSDYGYFAGSLEHIKKAQRFFDRSVEIGRSYPETADLLF